MATDGNTNSNNENIDFCKAENLICRNGSYCKQGKPNISPIHRPLGLQTHVTSKLDGHHYHCKCPQGYIGDDCAVQVTECAATRTDLVHHCYYGSQCVEADNDSGLLDRYCDCSTANTDDGVFVTGLMCQYKSTSVCVDEASEGRVLDQFCANGGKCNDIVDVMASHPGCSCGHKWEGNHCEFASGVLYDDALDFFQQRQTEISSQRRGGVAALPSSLTEESSKSYIPYVVVACLVSLFTIIFFLSRTRKTSNKRYILEDVDLVNNHLGIDSFNHSSQANIALQSNKRESDIDPWSEFDHKTSPYAPISNLESATSYGHDSQLVETLDADTSRIIEARFEKSKRNDSDVEDEEQEDKLCRSFTTPKTADTNGTYVKLHSSTLDKRYDVDDDSEEGIGPIPIITANNSNRFEDEYTANECVSVGSNSHISSLDGDCYYSDDDGGGGGGGVGII
eukprot:CCRYP_015681-RA/>CCRYP_015681-RA protein AED:0.21 eAED:0.21 QI:0/-1/0/1/-1/1/1/0/451